MDTPARPSHEDVVEVSEHTDEGRGLPSPLGTHEYGGGVNFALFRRHASRVRLEFFDPPADATPARVIDLDPVRNGTGDVRRFRFRGIGPGQLYAYRVDHPTGLTRKPSSLPVWFMKRADLTLPDVQLRRRLGRSLSARRIVGAAVASGRRHRARRATRTVCCWPGTALRRYANSPLSPVAAPYRWLAQ